MFLRSISALTTRFFFRQSSVGKPILCELNAGQSQSAGSATRSEVCSQHKHPSNELQRVTRTAENFLIIVLRALARGVEYRTCDWSQRQAVPRSVSPWS